MTVLLTLRADFLDRPLLYPEFARRLAAGMVTMPAPDLAELDEIVRRPAENLGVGFARGWWREGSSATSLISRELCPCWSTPSPSCSLTATATN